MVFAFFLQIFPITEQKGKIKLDIKHTSSNSFIFLGPWVRNLAVMDCFQSKYWLWNTNLTMRLFQWFIYYDQIIFFKACTFGWILFIWMANHMNKSINRRCSRFFFDKFFRFSWFRFFWFGFLWFGFFILWFLTI